MVRIRVGDKGGINMGETESFQRVFYHIPANFII